MSETEFEDAPEAEPDENEPDEVEVDEDDDDEVAAEPESAEVTPEQMEQRLGKIARSFKTYTGNVTRILEEQATEIVECPLCAGVVPGFVLIEGAGRVDEQTKQAVNAYLGIVQEADYRAAANVRTCGVCEGLGKVRSGSRVAQYTLLTCDRCNGFGFEPPPGPRQNGVAEPQAVLAAVSASGPDLPPDDTDPLGSPRLLPDGTLNPNYGKFPQFKDPDLP